MIAPLMALALAAASAGSLTLKAEANSATLTAADLAALPHVTAVVTDHGKTRTYSGVPLATLMAKVGAPTGETLRGKALLGVIVASASDGYRVALSLAETDPGMKAAKTIVADAEDGKPLSPKDGPFKLVVEGDLRPARAAHGLVGLELVRIP